MPSPPLVVTDGFLPAELALQMRRAIDEHFANPQSHRPETHQVWNYWFVPELYTYLRASPERVIGQEGAAAFYEALRRWSIATLGMANVTWPYLSLYVPGCRQGWHNDSLNGRFGFVYSLTRDLRRTLGGETLVRREADSFRDNLTQPQAGRGFYETVEPPLQPAADLRRSAATCGRAHRGRDGPGRGPLCAARAYQRRRPDRRGRPAGGGDRRPDRGRAGRLSRRGCRCGGAVSRAAGRAAVGGGNGKHHRLPCAARSGHSPRSRTRRLGSSVRAASRAVSRREVSASGGRDDDHPAGCLWPPAGRGGLIACGGTSALA